MKHWAIGTQLAVGFGSLVVMAFGMGGLAWWATSTLNRHVDQLAGVSGQALQQAADVRFLVADLNARERLVVIATAKQDTAVMAAETQTVQADYARLRETVARLAATGMSPADWLISARVDRARELLESSALSIDAIADECGFGSAITLRHHFRRKLGISPGAYRARFARPSQAYRG